MDLKPGLEPSQMRHFHKAGFVNPKQTRLRRNMMEWLNGPGKAFRDPLPSSTNYMSAYDRQGKLLRTRPPRQLDGRRGHQQQVDQEVVPEEQEEGLVKKEIADGLDATERQERYDARQLARDRKADLDARGGLPKERQSDMRPYPLNHNFRSQPVLSEELRETIWQQVVARGLDIGTVSAAFGVDTRRVAAVVRLKTIEKQWQQDVSRLRHPLGALPLHDDHNSKSISLEDTHMVTNFCFASLSDF